MLHGVMLTLQGTHQGSVLTPYLFFRYISDLVGIIAQSGLGCKVVNQPVNILAYMLTTRYLSLLHGQPHRVSFVNYAIDHYL